MAEIQTIHGKGKLLITGEYFVLDGAKALAIPTKFGQSFEFVPIDTAEILWTGYDDQSTCWLKEKITLPISDEQLPVASPRGRLLQVLQAAHSLNPVVFGKGWQVTSKLEFPTDWGLGSSSTMIYAVAKWAGVNPYELLKHTFGGSGYDIACAGADVPVLYTINSRAEPVSWAPDFRDQLYFVYLNQKQNSRDGIYHYQAANFDKHSIIQQLDVLTDRLLSCTNLNAFEALIKKHESLVGSSLQLPLVGETLFSDFWGAVKSLGAWGGDFVLVASDRGSKETISYFEGKGYPTVLQWEEMV